MKKTIFTLILLLLCVPESFAHSGRTDSCGGHNNRKTGGYHVHDYSKYNRCYPQTTETKKTVSTPKRTMSSDEMIKAACNKAYKSCLSACSDEGCKKACAAGKSACK